MGIIDPITPSHVSLFPISSWNVCDGNVLYTHVVLVVLHFLQVVISTDVEAK
jgi:hypothetical protein